MPNKRHDKQGRFAAVIDDEDKKVFIRWMQEERDFNQCCADIINQYRVSPITAHQWMTEALKKVGKK